MIYLYYMENGTEAIILIYKSLQIFSFLKQRAYRRIQGTEKANNPSSFLPSITQTTDA